jgi:hypothetical protein
MSEVAQRTIQEAHDIATREGLKAVLPESDELLIDLDGEATLNLGVLKALRSTLSSPQDYFDHILYTTSKSGSNKHAYIKLYAPVSNEARIALQACLGSDSVREVLSILRCNLESEAPTVLFETSREYLNVLRWRENLKYSIQVSKA